MPRAREPTSRLPCRGRRAHFWLGRPDLGFLAPAVASPAQWVSTLPSLGSLLLLLETAVGLELMEAPLCCPSCGYRYVMEGLGFSAIVRGPIHQLPGWESSSGGFLILQLAASGPPPSGRWQKLISAGPPGGPVLWCCSGLVPGGLLGACTSWPSSDAGKHLSPCIKTASA